MRQPHYRRPLVIGPDIKLSAKKPIIPLSSEPELSAFRMDFLNSTVLFFSSFLVIKDRASVRALASCDAAWWTRLILTEQLSTADEGSIAPLEDTNAWRRRTLVELRHIMHSGVRPRTFCIMKNPPLLTSAFFSALCQIDSVMQPADIGLIKHSRKPKRWTGVVNTGLNSSPLAHFTLARNAIYLARCLL